MVRRLTFEDLSELCAFGRENYRRIKPFREEFDSNYFRRVWDEALRTDMGVVWLDQFGGSWRAVLGASFSRDMFTGQMTAYGQFWFTHPLYRGQKLGIRLAHEFFQEARVRKAKKILMGHPRIVNKKFGAAFFKSEKFDAVEVLYQKELND
jgi:hypothetical protein